MHMLTAVLVAALLAATPATPPAKMGRLETISREFVTNFTSSRFEAAAKDFNSELAGVVTPAIITDIRKQVGAAAGAFQSVTSARQYRFENSRAFELIAEHQRSLVAYRLVFDQFDRVAAVYVEAVQPQNFTILEERAREFLANFTAARWSEARKSFDKTLGGQLSPLALADLAKNLGTQFGAFRSITAATPTVDGRFRVVTLSTAWEKANVEVRVTFDAEGAINGVRIAPSQQAAAQ